MGKGEGGFEELVSNVIGCCLRVHMELGPGFLESVYHRALEVELAENDIQFESEKEVAISFRGHFVGDHRLDFLVDDELVVELKTVEKLGRDHYAQVRSYEGGRAEEAGIARQLRGVQARRTEGGNKMKHHPPSPFPIFPVSPPYTGTST